MNKADKPVPVFMVIAPSFTSESEMQVVQYTAQNLSRNIVLITVAELRRLPKSGQRIKQEEDSRFVRSLLERVGSIEYC